MIKTIDTLIPDILALFDGHSVSEGVDHFSDKLGKVFIERFAQYETERKPTLRLSNLGKPLRQLYYELNGFPQEELPSHAKVKFLYGDILEHMMLFLAIEAGHEVTDLQREVDIEGVPGHIDAIIDGTLVDVKSCSPASFDKFKTGKLFEDDPFGYIYQLSSYWAAVSTERAGFLCIDKVLGQIHFMELTHENRKSPADVRGRIAEVREAVDRPSEPQRCYEPIPLSKKDRSGNLVLPVGCSYCGWKQHCWRDANNGEGLKTYVYSTGPKYFTHINKTPRVQEQQEEEFPAKEVT